MKHYATQQRSHPKEVGILLVSVESILSQRDWLKKFSTMFFYKFNIEKQSYDKRLNVLRVHSLESRRMLIDKVTLFKLVSRRIDSQLYNQFSRNRGLNLPGRGMSFVFQTSRSRPRSLRYCPITIVFRSLKVSSKIYLIFDRWAHCVLYLCEWFS